MWIVFGDQAGHNRSSRDANMKFSDSKHTPTRPIGILLFRHVSTMYSSDTYISKVMGPVVLLKLEGIYAA